MNKNVHTGFVKNNKLLYFVGVLLMVIQVLVNLAVTYLMQILMDAGLKKSTELLIRAAIGVIVVLIVELVVVLGCIYVQASYTKKKLCRYKKESFRRLIKGTLRSFMSREQGEYLSAFTNDMEPVARGYIKSLFNIPFYSVMLAGSIVMMMCYHVGYTLVVIGVAVIPLGIGILAGRVMAPAEKQLSTANARFTAKLKEILGGIPVIKSFRAEDSIAGLFCEQDEELENTRYRRTIVAGRIQALMECMSGWAQFIVFIFGAYLSVRGVIDVSVMIVFIQLMSSVNAPLSALPTAFATYSGGKAVICRMEELTEHGREISPQEEISGLKKGIYMEGVSFAYETGHEILHDFCYHFEKGKAYAIVGPSGSGKSTVVKLMLGYFPNYEGRILYDDRELKTLSEDTLNRLNSFVQQEVFLFDKTVEENVTMFHPYEREEVSRVLSMVGLERLEKEKEGMTCGDNGSNLSGGERQRVSIARALIRKCPVMLWDEATAALDTETAGRVMRLVLSAKDMTRIIITHQLDEAILKQFDSILVVKDGILCESGTYSSLMEQNGILHAMKALEEA